MMRRAALLLAVLALGGCGNLGYYWKSVGGQLEIWQREAPVERLLAAGADPTWTKGGESAVDLALKTGNTDIAEKIMKAQEKVGFGRSEVLKESEDSDEAAAATQ